MGCIINANIDLIVDDSIETLRLGIALIEVMNESACGVWNLGLLSMLRLPYVEGATYGLDGELVEPITGIVSVPEGICGLCNSC